VVFEVAAVLLLAQSASSAATVRELEAIEQRLAATYASGDCDGWGRMLADDWSVIHITGTIITKAEALATCKISPVKIAEFKIEDVKVRLFGGSAVVTGRTTAVAAGATPITVVLRFTDVFVRRNGRWTVVASHATRLGS
jgi:ketosteroid isomerase-like protein